MDLRRLISKFVGRRRPIAALGLIACLLFAQQSIAADNFIQLYIASKGGCGGGVSPLTFVLTGQEINAPFGKAAADWSDDDLASLKTVLAACLVTSARRGNPYALDEHKREADELLTKIPAIISQARDQVQAQAEQMEARRQLASARIDKATQARQKAKASAETEVARLEHEATMAEAAARDAQTRANARIAQATHARNEAQAKADAIASLERSAQEDAGTMPRARRAAPGELSELIQDDDHADVQSGKLAGPLTTTTAADALACPTIDDMARAGHLNASPQDKANPAPVTSGPCTTIAKGTRTTIQAAGAGLGLKALCVTLKGHPSCLWVAKTAFAPADQQQ